MSGLDRDQIELMTEWFDEEVLKNIRVARPVQIRFIFASLGRRLWPSALSGNPRGLCLGRVILIDQSVREFDKVLFHELVHTEQWRSLGACRFLGRYVREVMRDGYFDESGLEGMARMLTARFNRGEPFDVQKEVEASLVRERTGHR